MPTFKPQRLTGDCRKTNMDLLQYRNLDPAVALVAALGDNWIETVKYIRMLHHAVTQMESVEEWQYWLKQVKYTPTPVTPAQTASAAPASPGVAFRDGDKVAIKWTPAGAIVGNKTTHQNVTALAAAALGLTVKHGAIVTSDRIGLITAIATKFPVDGEIEQQQS